MFSQGRSVQLGGSGDDFGVPIRNHEMKVRYYIQKNSMLVLGRAEAIRKDTTLECGISTYCNTH